MASLNGTTVAFHPKALNLFHRNARRGDVDAIASSLQRNGQYRPVTVNKGTLTGRPDEVLAGNHTLLAARSLEWTTIDAYVIDVDDETATRINVADNRTGQLGGFDSDALTALLADFGDDLTGTGFTAEEVDALRVPFGGPIEFPEDPTPAPASDSEPAEGVPGPRSIALGSLSAKHLTYLAEQLPALREEFELESNADVIVMLVMAHTGIRPA